MIQRIQSIFLLLVALCMIAILFVPMWEKVDAEKNEKITLSAIEQVYEKQDIETNEIQLIAKKQTFYIAILAVLVAGVAFYSISRYDNRLLQMKLGALNSLLMAAAIGLTVYFVIQAEPMIAPESRGDYIEGFYLGVGAMLCNVLANRFIRRDERLVRSADRIR